MSDPTPNQPDDAEAPEAGDTEERPAAEPFDDEAPTTQWSAVGDEAPEAAMDAAYAYKQVGEYDKAIEMYELFISKYGDEKTLQKLKNGDPKANPPVAAQP